MSKGQSLQDFDQFVILLRNTVNQMIYKSAISTVVPSRAVNLDYDDPMAWRSLD